MTEMALFASSEYLKCMQRKKPFYHISLRTASKSIMSRSIKLPDVLIHILQSNVISELLAWLKVRPHSSMNETFFSAQGLLENSAMSTRLSTGARDF